MPQPENEFTATQALKRFDPLWYRLREAITIQKLFAAVVAAIGLLITAVVQFHGLRNDLNDLKTGFGNSTEQVKNVADLQARVKVLEDLEHERRALTDKTYQDLQNDARLHPRRRR